MLSDETGDLEYEDFSPFGAFGILHERVVRSRVGSLRLRLISSTLFSKVSTDEDVVVEASLFSNNRAVGQLEVGFFSSTGG